MMRVVGGVAAVLLLGTLLVAWWSVGEPVPASCVPGTSAPPNGYVREFNGDSYSCAEL
jgi:hypothetical protein